MTALVNSALASSHASGDAARSFANREGTSDASPYACLYAAQSGESNSSITHLLVANFSFMTNSQVVSVSNDSEFANGRITTLFHGWSTSCQYGRKTLWYNSLLSNRPEML